MRLWKKRDPNRCRVDEEWCGVFIGRRYCKTHAIVWDDGGSCPRRGEEPGQPFAFARYRLAGGRR